MPLSLLDERQRHILSLRYGLEDGEPKTPKEISEQIGVTRERIRQILCRIMAKLQKNADQVTKAKTA